MNEPVEVVEEGTGLKLEFSRLAKRKIKAGALKCFGQHGYHGTTIRQIAKAAGTTHTTFYQYFKSKAELVVEMGHDTEPTLLDIARTLNKSLENPSRACIREWLDQYYDMWVQNHTVFDIYWEALGERRVADDILPFANNMSEELSCILSRVDPRDLDRIRTSISLMMFQVYQAMLVAFWMKEKRKKKHIFDAMADMLWNSISVWLKAE